FFVTLKQAALTYAHQSACVLQGFQIIFQHKLVFRRDVGKLQTITYVGMTADYNSLGANLAFADPEHNVYLGRNLLRESHFQIAAAKAQICRLGAYRRGDHRPAEFHWNISLHPGILSFLWPGHSLNLPQSLITFMRDQ